MVVVEIQASELADAEFGVDVDAGVDFFAAVAVGFEAIAGLEEFDLGGVLFFVGRRCDFGFFLRGLLGFAG